MPALKPSISQNFDGAIWRMDVDPITQTLFAEIRNEANRQVSFAAINLGSGTVNFKDFLPDEKWLTGLEASWQGVLLLHQYGSPASPSHKGLIAIDGRNGAVLWSNYIYTFDHISSNGPVVFDSRIQPVKLLLLDIKTGAVIRAFNDTVDQLPDNQISLPQLADASTLLVNLPEIPVGNIVHYLEYNTCRIVSLHALREGKLMQVLYILAGETLLFDDLLNSNIQKLQPEAFVLHRNRLIYLKNKSQINVLNL